MTLFTIYNSVPDTGFKPAPADIGRDLRPWPADIGHAQRTFRKVAKLYSEKGATGQLYFRTLFGRLIGIFDQKEVNSIYGNN